MPLEDEHGACPRLHRIPAADIGAWIVAGPEPLSDIGRIVEAYRPAMQRGLGTIGVQHDPRVIGADDVGLDMGVGIDAHVLPQRAPLPKGVRHHADVAGVVVAIGEMQVFPDSCRHHLRQNGDGRILPVHEEVVTQMPEMVGLVSNVAAVVRVPNTVHQSILGRQSVQAIIEALRHLPVLVQDEGGIDQLELGRGRDLHHTTSKMILPIAV